MRIRKKKAKKKEEKRKDKKKVDYYKIAIIGALNTKFYRMLSMYIYYINYFIFIIYYHDGWFIGL